MNRIPGHVLVRGTIIVISVVVFMYLIAAMQNPENLRATKSSSSSSSFGTWSKADTISAFFNSKRVQDAQKHLAFFYEFEDKEAKIYSQNGEDGVISHLFDNLGTTDKFYVEFGVQTCSECVTKYLWEKKGWDGVLMDGDGKTNDARVIYNHFLTAENIVSLFELHNVPKPVFDFLSVDIDYNDFFVATQIFEAGYRPNLLSMEVNRNFAIHQSYTIKYNARKMWDGTHRFGLSPLAAARLANKYGYSPIYYEHNGVNMFFVKRARVADYLKEKTGFDFTEAEVEVLLPKYEHVYRHHAPIHFHGSWEDFQVLLPREIAIWDEVGEDGNVVGSN